MNINCIQELHGQIGGTGESAPPTGSRIFSKGELAENIAKGDIVSVTAYGTVQDNPPDIKYTPSNSQCSTSMSLDGSILAIALTVTPYVATYKWVGANNRYEKTANIDVIPNAHSLSTHLSDNGLFLIIGGAFNTRPAFLRSYKWVEANNRYELTAAPDYLPTASVYEAKVSSDGSFLVAVHAGNAASPVPARIVTYKWVEANNRYELTAAPNIVFSAALVNACITADGSIITVSAANTQAFFILKWSAANNRYEEEPTLSPPLSNGIPKHLLSMDGTKIIIEHNIAGERFMLYVWSSTNLVFEKTIASDYIVPNTITSMALSPDGLTFICTGTLGSSGDTDSFWIFRWASGYFKLQASVLGAPFNGIFVINGIATNGTKIACAAASGTLKSASFTINPTATYSIQKLISPRPVAPWAEAFVGYANTAGTTGQTVPITALTWTRQYFEDQLDPI